MTHAVQELDSKFEFFTEEKKCNEIKNYDVHQWEKKYDEMTRNQKIEYMVVLNSIYNTKKT